MRIHPVILSGGSGSRLWPLSREHYPKQLLALLTERTLLQETAARLDQLADAAPPLLVCNEEHRFLVAEQLRELGRSPAAIILEPCGRNTAPALTLAALSVCESAPDDLLLVMPADHVIRDGAAFAGAIRQARSQAAAGAIVTFGIAPDRPETGYGYIRKGEAAGEGGWRVGAFVEKPDFETARRYQESGDYFWNSGMFLLRASLWLEELRRHRPEMAAACEAAYRGGRRDGEFYRVAREAFAACPSDSIDYAVMEKTQRAVVLPLAAGWSDIGAWQAVHDLGAQDADGNVIQGDVLASGTHNSLLISQHRFLAALGLEDLVVVETADAVLVARKAHAQAVKDLVTELKSRSREEAKTHRRVYRPWGHYESVDAGPGFQVKRITVRPGAALSLQMHRQRAEHWIVVSGTARVTRGEETFLLHANQSTYIPVGAKHRLENPESTPLKLIEVQSGNYLGEDDIVRFEDRYDRCQQP
jgi:mannose-1-phosphate guanylyltransferase/mannose-1-phosphate guanylyltransferase/mannose-6-phosphate isomerase